jgi:hypothetical protein
MDDTSHVDFDEEFDLVGTSHLQSGWFGQSPSHQKQRGGLSRLQNLFFYRTMMK